MEQKQYLREKLPEMIELVSHLVQIPTVWDPASAGVGKPFGKNIAIGLGTFLKLAGQMGFATRNYDGYAGEVTAGQGHRMIGILGHLDVVKASPGWSTPPFQPVIRQNKIYGRGVSDDKDPLVSCLYAMRYLMQEKRIPEGCSIRLIAGCDEEEGMQCIAYYKKKAERLPDESFVPDGYFPLVNCEKGLIDFDLLYPAVSEKGPEVIPVLQFQGGAGRNIVPDRAECILKVLPSEKDIIARLQSNPQLQIKEDEDSSHLILQTRGKAAHAMSPELGKNAISILVEALLDSGLTFSCQAFLEKYEKLIGRTVFGEKMNCACEDAESGRLTLNIGKAEQRENAFLIEANVRYPCSKNHQWIVDAMMGQFSASGFQVKERLAMDPLYIDKKDPLVQKLMEAYQEVTGDFQHDAFAIGGATYARYLPHTVSFGPLFPGEKELAHEDDEFLEIESLEKMTQIYIDALEKLLEE